MQKKPKRKLKGSLSKVDGFEKQKKCYVAFIDVIGFSNIINSNNEKKIKSYLKIIEQWAKYTEEWQQAGEEIGFKSISDSIIIFIKYDSPVKGNKPVPLEHSLRILIYLVSKLQILFLQNEILTRGAISTGDVAEHKKTNSILGNGIINAYKLEKLASLPRVIIDPNIVYENYKNPIVFQQRFGRLTYTKEDIGFSTISLNSQKSITTVFKALSINYGSDYILQILIKSKNIKEIRSKISKLHNFVASGIYTQPEYSEKYRWLANHIFEAYKELNTDKAFKQLNMDTEIGIKALLQSFGHF